MNNKMWKQLKTIFDTNPDLHDKYLDLSEAISLIVESIDLNERQQEIQEKITKLKKEEK